MRPHLQSNSCKSVREAWEQPSFSDVCHWFSCREIFRLVQIPYDSEAVGLLCECGPFLTIRVRVPSLGAYMMDYAKGGDVLNHISKLSFRIFYLLYILIYICFLFLHPIIIALSSPGIMGGQDSESNDSPCLAPGHVPATPRHCFITSCAAAFPRHIENTYRFPFTHSGVVHFRESCTRTHLATDHARRSVAEVG